MYICRRALDQRLLFALPPAGPGPAPLAIFTHGSDVGRNQLRTWSFSTEAHWLRENGFAVLALMRRGRGRSEGINGEEDFGREHDGSLIDCFGRRRTERRGRCAPPNPPTKADQPQTRCMTSRLVPIRRSERRRAAPRPTCKIAPCGA
jgi:hypothetical protein